MVPAHFQQKGIDEAKAGPTNNWEPLFNVFFLLLVYVMLCVMCRMNPTVVQLHPWLRAPTVAEISFFFAFWISALIYNIYKTHTCCCWMGRLTWIILCAQYQQQWTSSCACHRRFSIARATYFARSPLFIFFAYYYWWVI